jgi:hypothetical protein
MHDTMTTTKEQSSIIVDLLTQTTVVNIKEMTPPSSLDKRKGNSPF